jgi:predicted ArsR family transcriptional regulator
MALEVGNIVKASLFLATLCKISAMIDQPSVLDPDDALSQPTRANLFALLGELGRPAGTAELAERLKLHPNGVRLHLERLERDGLVLRASDPQPRGRPRDAWKIAPDARPGGRSPRAYSDLVRWLARATGSGSRGLRGIENAGREIGRELGADQAAAGEEALQTAITALGFQPRVRARKGDKLTIALRNCPYEDAVRENQPVICTLHRGITRGLLDVLAPQSKLAGFEPRDPRVGGCLVELTGVSRQSEK